jgi:hypothetical protein
MNLIVFWECNTGTKLNGLHISLWAMKASERTNALSAVLTSAQHAACSLINCRAMQFKL